MQTHTHATAGRDSASGPNALIGIVAGLVAGIAYLAAQMSFATLQGGVGWEPLQRIAAMLLGPDAVPPPGRISGVIVGMGLLIHLPLSALFGRLVDTAVRGLGLVAASLGGAAIGALMYALNRWFIAPFAFPWFEQSNNIVTAMDHVLFGVVAAVCCVQLRQLYAHRRDLP